MGKPTGNILIDFLPCLMKFMMNAFIKVNNSQIKNMRYLFILSALVPLLGCVSHPKEMKEYLLYESRRPTSDMEFSINHEPAHIVLIDNDGLETAVFFELTNDEKASVVKIFRRTHLKSPQVYKASGLSEKHVCFYIKLWANDKTRFIPFALPEEVYLEEDEMFVFWRIYERSLKETKMNKDKTFICDGVR
jgi:hypothetical protein